MSSDTSPVKGSAWIAATVSWKRVKACWPADENSLTSLPSRLELEQVAVG